MKQKSNPMSKKAVLASAICWTICTLLWIVSMILNFLWNPGTILPYVQILVALLSIINAIINWRRYATYEK